MSRLRLVVLSMLAALAVSAVGASATFAAGPQWEVCKEVAAGTGVYEDAFCSKPGGGKEWEWVALTPFQEETLLSAGGPFELETVIGVAITIECEEQVGEALIFGTQPGSDSDEMFFVKCALFGVAGCEVVEPIVVESAVTILRFVVRRGGKWVPVTEAEYLAAPGKGELRELADEFKPGVGKAGVLATIEIKKCLIAGKYQVKGTTLGLVNNATESLEFEGPETSSLKIGAAAADLYGASKQMLVKLVGLKVGV